MSVRDQLRVHLEDFAVLVFSLLECASSPDLRIKMPTLMDKLLHKNILLQHAVSTLLVHQEFQRKIYQMQKELSELDTKIIHFTNQLGALEQTLNDAIVDEKISKSVDGVITQQRFSVHEVAAFAEKLGLMSVAPADFIERNGISPCRPPAPLEDLIGQSRLHLPLHGLLSSVLLDETSKGVQSQEKLPTAFFSPLAHVSASTSSSSPFSDLFKPPVGWKPGDVVTAEHLASL